MSKISRRTVMGAALAVGAVAGLPRIGHSQTLPKVIAGCGSNPAFANLIVGKEKGIFAKSGVDLDIRIEATGSALVPMLVSSQIQMVYGADSTGIVANAQDPNFVAVADGTRLNHWVQLIATKNVPTLEALKGKKLGFPKGTGSDFSWTVMIDHYKLNPADYTVLNVDYPEALAAMERGDIDATLITEPFASRILNALHGSSVLSYTDGFFNTRDFIYMKRDWIAANRDTAEKFMRGLLESNDFVKQNKAESIEITSKFLKIPKDLTELLFSHLDFNVSWNDDAISCIKLLERILTQQGRLKKPIDYKSYVDTDLIKAVRPAAITMSPLPT